ncbi:anaerobic ribonucleoside-triphosphate reductase activating protein [Desulfallas sp. Bu1-1]|jgi:anaerobic ribonucleoside-triphosphate reductase activating protein|uniref:anaerobic ribonucleoside-triphosphate reductase activating protein n=1 Tax=Desulfallas sp. Bu1-1 TaxID=2787620 RepID=UPI0018A00239|nr:anaerobic ribonucleoside-triphosphate reductase activating protein [Desulfallas sp. Bu1-1]MBF7083194.1 anaerobic ribonucleoside-triphosphate reductase activating protein [Desulfallas sp. Bu1-1]
MNDKTVRLAGLTPESVVDGLGLRFVIWAQGCRHRCPGCHSPFTWDFAGGRPYDMDEIINQVKRNPVLKGVTFSGGDPMEQAGKFAYLAGEIKKLGLDVWCYTGYTFEHILQNMDSRAGWRGFLENIDVLVDGRFEQDQRDLNLAFRGSRNQRIIDVPASLRSNRVTLLQL